MVEVVQRHDEPDVVLADEVGEGVDVAGVGDARDDRLTVRVVQRRRERVRVGGERDAARSAKRADDVDALPRAGEEDDRHERRAYSPRVDRRSPATSG